MPAPDILVFLSDQHTPLLSSYMGGLARTPNMEQMAGSGISFNAAYTPSPLCVPARMSMLSGRLPSTIGVLNNSSTLADDIPTFADSLAAAGYETVLIGRMHFIGENQRHGFQHRLVGDITNVSYRPDRERMQKVRGVYMRCFSETHCTELYGGGASPVLEYDEEVVNSAIDWLSSNHEKPQFIIVGTYGPHFPYVAPPEKYQYYKNLVSLPRWFDNPPDYLDPVQRMRAEKSTRERETALGALAAYCGMIEETDRHLGRVRNTFRDFCGKRGREYLMIYTSDHGDQCGERGLFGKMSFFEKSARIPLIIEGTHIAASKNVAVPVSLIDIGPTVCAAAGVNAPARDGIDILNTPEHGMAERPVISEIFGSNINLEEHKTLSRMVRIGRYKYITRDGFEAWDMLFDMDADPGESRNRAQEYPGLVMQLRKYLEGLPDPKIVKEKVREANALWARLQKDGEPSAALLAEAWCGTGEAARRLPEIV